MLQQQHQPQPLMLLAAPCAVRAEWTAMVATMQAVEQQEQQQKQGKQQHSNATAAPGSHGGSSLDSAWVLAADLDAVFSFACGLPGSVPPPVAALLLVGLVPFLAYHGSWATLSFLVKLAGRAGLLSAAKAAAQQHLQQQALGVLEAAAAAPSGTAAAAARPPAAATAVAAAAVAVAVAAAAAGAGAGVHPVPHVKRAAVAQQLPHGQRAGAKRPRTSTTASCSHRSSAAPGPRADVAVSSTRAASLAQAGANLASSTLIGPAAVHVPSPMRLRLMLLGPLLLQLVVVLLCVCVLFAIA